MFVDRNLTFRYRIIYYKNNLAFGLPIHTNKYDKAIEIFNNHANSFGVNHVILEEHYGDMDNPRILKEWNRE